MCKLCRDRDVAIANGKEYSADLAEYSESRGNPNLTVIPESGLYRILAKCNLPKCEPFETYQIRKFPSWATSPNALQRETSGTVMRTASPDLSSHKSGLYFFHQFMYKPRQHAGETREA